MIYEGAVLIVSVIWFSIVPLGISYTLVTVNPNKSPLMPSVICTNPCPSTSTAKIQAYNNNNNLLYYSCSFLKIQASSDTKHKLLILLRLNDHVQGVYVSGTEHNRKLKFSSKLI